MAANTAGTKNRAPRAGRESGTRGRADVLAFHRALTDLVRVYQFRDRERICCYDVSVTQCYALEALVLRGPLTLNALASELYLDKSTASRVVDGLEAKGYAKRGPHPESRRSLLLAATPAGRRLHVRIEAELLGQEERLLAEFPPDVRSGMTRVLENLARATAARVEASGGTCCWTEPVQVGRRGGTSTESDTKAAERKGGAYS